MVDLCLTRVSAFKFDECGVWLVGLYLVGLYLGYLVGAASVPVVTVCFGFGLMLAVVA